LARDGDAWSDPIAVHTVAELHITSVRTVPGYAANPGMGCSVQAAPSHRSTTLRFSGKSGVLPTAVHATGELHDTLVSITCEGCGAGDISLDHPVPFQTSMRVCQGGAAPLTDGG
jgi:hypothetical protein